ncbi:uncharacterized protein LOC124492201 isoform X2 [Dermatophagoides farinae]
MTQETNNLVKSLSSPSSATKSKQIIKTDNNKGTDGEKRKSRSHRVQQKPEFMTRIVIRQLPPTMNEEQFLEVVSPLPAHTEFYYVNGDVNLAEFAFSRAYIKFTNIDDMLIFNQKYDDYIFLDSKGNEYPAIVEYAPMQKLPRRLNSMNIKKDSKANTIDNDPDFIAFKEALETIQNDGTTASQQQQTITTAEQLLEEIEKNKESKENINQIPPLVEYLNKKRLEKLKIQEEKKRKKDELKKKKKEEIRIKKLEKKKEKQMEQKKSKQTTEKSSTKDRIDNKQQIDRKTVIIVSGGSGVGGDRRKRQEKQQQPSPQSQAATSSSSSNSNIAKDSKKSSSNEMDENSKSNVKIMNKNDDNQQTPTKNHKEKEKSNSNSSNRRDDRQRIRNKDRPTLEIYRPGMGRHQQQQQSIQKSSNSSSSSNHQQQQQQTGIGDDNKPKDSITQSSPSSSTTIPSKQTGTTNQNYSDKPKYKYRVFTRTRTNKPNN